MRIGTLIVMLFMACANIASADDSAIWKEFVSELKNGQFKPEQIHPIRDGLRQPLMTFLEQMRAKASWMEWEKQPEQYRVGNRVHFLVPLTFEKNRQTYCFSFVVENGVWFFRHLESITIRLDQIGSLPVSSFPELPENQKAWMRQENYWTQMVMLFNVVTKLKDKQSGFELFRDGKGYLLQAETWVPFYESAKAFILYLCWEQSKLQGNEVTLTELTPDRAVVQLKPIYLRLYEQTAHLRQQISRDDYRHIFSTIWQDRAKAAGWNIKMDCPQSDCTLEFTRSNP